MDTETTPKRRGRPPGTPQPTKYGEPSTTKTHRMTPKAHEWVKQNREFIEQQARS